MSFMDYTLVPGGSFVMCETISEFDENVPAPVPVNDATPPEEAKKVVETLQNKHWVSSVLNDLKEIYGPLIMPLINLPLDRTSDEDVVSAADMISSTATSVVEQLIPLLMKVQMSRKMCLQNSEEFTYAPVREVLGIVIENKQQLIKDGYGNISFSYTTHPAFESWGANRIIKMLLKNPELIKHNVIDMNTITEISDCKPMFDLFDSIPDMFDTMFNNPERRARQEMFITDGESLDTIIKYRLGDAPVMDPNCPHDEDPFCMLTRGLSKMLRKVKQKCYGLYCDASERECEMTIEQRNKCLYHCGALVVNMFVISAIALISHAYLIQRCMDKQQCIQNWCDEIQRKYSKR